MKSLFLNQDHDELYKKYCNLSHMHLKDRERKAFFFILSGNPDLISKGINNIYNFRENQLEIDINEGVNFDLCTSSEALLKLACNLYNSSLHSLSVSNTLSNLDEDNFHLAITAMRIRFEPYLEF